MASQNCIFKAVTLKAGEVFVLPPGAKLESVSDASAVTSSCSGDLPEAELKCYKVTWTDSNTRNKYDFVSTPLGIAPNVLFPSNASLAWDSDPDNILITNISLGGQITQNVNVDMRYLNLLEPVINALNNSALLIDRKYKYHTAPTAAPSLSDGAPTHFDPELKLTYNTYSIYFKATETVAKTFYLQFGDNPNVGSIPRFFPEEIDCETYPTDSDVTVCGS